MKATPPNILRSTSVGWSASVARTRAAKASSYGIAPPKDNHVDHYSRRSACCSRAVVHTNVLGAVSPGNPRLRRAVEDSRQTEKGEAHQAPGPRLHWPRPTPGARARRMTGRRWTLRLGRMRVPKLGESPFSAVSGQP